MDLVADAVQAVEFAYDKGLSLDDGEHTASVATRHCVVFNTRLVGVLMRVHYHEEQTFADLRRREPRRFHELIGQHIGDFILRDRIYGLPKFMRLPSAYSLQGFIVDGRLSMDALKRRELDVLGALSACGEAEMVPSESSYIEAMASKFADGHDGVSCRLEFATVARLRKGGIVRSVLADHVLIASGNLRTQAQEEPLGSNVNPSYSGPLLYFAVRGKSGRHRRHIDALRRALTCVVE